MLFDILVKGRGAGTFPKSEGNARSDGLLPIYNLPSCKVKLLGEDAQTSSPNRKCNQGYNLTYFIV